MSKLYLNGRLCNGHAGSKSTEEEANQYTLVELKQVAKDNGVPNASRLNKEALCQAILDFAKSKSVMVVGPPMVQQPVAAVPVLVKSVEKPVIKSPIIEPVVAKASNGMKGKTAPKNDSRGCTKQFDKKYLERNSPPFPANQCCGQKMLGNDNKMYESRADKNGTCKWYLVK